MSRLAEAAVSGGRIVAIRGKVVARCIGLTPARGLARGSPVEDCDAMLQVPVGEQLLGRMLNVLGRPIDGGGEVAAERRLPIHRPPLPLARRITSREIFATGIKVIDLLAPSSAAARPGCSAARASARWC